MKRIILTVAVAITASLIGFTPAHAEQGDSGIAGCNIFCLKKKCTTVEVCRRCFTKTICVSGCAQQIEYIEVTYCTTYCDGSIKNWTKIYRA